MPGKTSERLLRERKGRLCAAVRLEKTDRVPVLLGYDAFAAYQTGMKLSEFANDPGQAGQAMLSTLEMLGDVEGIQKPVGSPSALAVLWLSRVRRPGVELPDDQLWQVEERSLMTTEDYVRIENEGWEAWHGEYLERHLSDFLPGVRAMGEVAPGLMEEYSRRGFVVFSPGAGVTIPYEYFCGARSLKEFILDLHRIPDRVEAAMNVAMVAIVGAAQAQYSAMPVRPMAAWVGGWRSASEFLSPRLWQRFVFPYVKQAVDVLLQVGVVPVLHFDADWTRDLERLRELPRRKCILALDGKTDIFKAKALLGDHMCILGDVPPSLLSLGTPREVRDYSLRLSREIGPSGFILAAGCYVPPDAKLENLRAMVEAAGA